MSDSVITEREQLDVERLTRILREAGALHAGSVSGIRLEPREGTNARMFALQVEYGPGSTGFLPSQLLLKMTDCGQQGFGASEVDYHVRDYAGLPEAPIPRCYHAAYSHQEGRYHILMDDLSATHRSNWKIPPNKEYGEAVAEALAILHAHYWHAGRRERIGAVIPGEAEIAEYMAHIAPGVEPMLRASRGEIDPAWADMARDAVAHHPPLMLDRTKRPTGFTVIHGDVNPGNVLSPYHGARPVYLIDRQPFDWSLTTWLGVSDVAYLMVHWWDTDLRRRFEVPVLQRYHQTLVDRGVDDYSWDQLMLDYRLSAVQSLYVAAAWCTDPEECTAMKWAWLQQLRKAMAALLDLRCFELW